jgi:CRISPR/Cas system CMR-associated protein Cmr1 (group 7 of RAMP superfamily)
MDAVRIQLNHADQFRIVLMEDLDHIRRYRKNAAALLILLGGIGACNSDGTTPMVDSSTSVP